MKINYVNYNTNYKQNLYNYNKVSNSNNNISFNSRYMEHFTKNELSRLASYASALKGDKMPLNMMIGPTFDTIDKIMKIGSSYSSLPEFLQLALRAEHGISNKLVLKAKHFSCLCAERYPKENYAKEVDEVLNQIETSEPVVLQGLLANPLWSYANVLQRQADWISVNQAIIKECDEREKTVNIKIENLDEKFTKECLALREQIRSERQDRQNAIRYLKRLMGGLADSIPYPGSIPGMSGYSLSQIGGHGHSNQRN